MAVNDGVSSTESEVHKKIETRPAENIKVFDPQEHEDKTRSTLAMVFVIGYFIILASGIIFVMINNILVEYLKLNKEIIVNVKDIILTISGAVGTSLGFVVGYYFKSSEKPQG